MITKAILIARNIRDAFRVQQMVYVMRVGNSCAIRGISREDRVVLRMKELSSLQDMFLM